METSRTRRPAYVFAAIILAGGIAIAASAYLLQPSSGESQAVESLQARFKGLEAADTAYSSSPGGQALLEDITSQLSALRAQVPESNGTAFQEQVSFLGSELDDLQASANGCGGTQPAPTFVTFPNDTIVEPVLLMNPGSSAVACVTYDTAWVQNSSIYNRPSFLSERSWNFSLPVTYNSCSEAGCYKASVSHSFATTANPPAVRLTEGLHYVTVVYEITALANSTGFYEYSVPWGLCDGFRLAVGYLPSEVNATDFENMNGFQTCPDQPVSVFGTTIAGFNSTDVGFQLTAFLP